MMKGYLQSTRSAWGSFLLTLPLLVLYQVAVLAANAGSGRGVINAADAMVRSVLGLVGVHGWLLGSVVAAGIAGFIAYRVDGRGTRAVLKREHLPLALLESALYALVLGSFVAYLVALVLPGSGWLQMGGGGLSFGQRLAVGLGAGLYEELVFRLLLMGGLLWALRRGGMRDLPAALLALGGSSVLFSLFHYVGPGGEAFRVGSFTFRLIAGLVLGALYWSRGFAVTAWTHSLYDVFLTLVGADVA